MNAIRSPLAATLMHHDLRTAVRVNLAEAQRPKAQKAPIPAPRPSAYKAGHQREEGGRPAFLPAVGLAPKTKGQARSGIRDSSPMIRLCAYFGVPWPGFTAVCQLCRRAIWFRPLLRSAGLHSVNWPQTGRSAGHTVHQPARPARRRPRHGKDKWPAVAGYLRHPSTAGDFPSVKRRWGCPVP